MSADAALQRGSQLGKGGVLVSGLAKGAEKSGGVLDGRQTFAADIADEEPCRVVGPGGGVQVAADQGVRSGRPVRTGDAQRTQLPGQGCSTTRWATSATARTWLSSLRSRSCRARAATTKPDTTSRAAMWIGRRDECSRPSWRSMTNIAALATTAVPAVKREEPNAAVEVGAATRRGDRWTATGAKVAARVIAVISVTGTAAWARTTPATDGPTPGGCATDATHARRYVHRRPGASACRSRPGRPGERSGS